MKRILGLMALCSGMAWAGKPAGRPKTSDSDVGVPIRQAKFYAKIEKHSFTLEPDYEWKTEKVCLTQGTFTVFRGPVEGNQSDNRASCPATLDGKPVRVVVGGGIGIGKGDFAGRETELKSLWTGIYVEDAKGEQVTPLNAMQIVPSRDIATSSLMAFVSPLSWAESWSDHPSLTEYFSAEIDAEDAP